jgi:hypothetical protein
MNWKSSTRISLVRRIFFLLICLSFDTIRFVDSEPTIIVNYDHLFDTPSPAEEFPRLSSASSVNTLKTKPASHNRQLKTFALDLDRIDRNVHSQYDSFGSLRGSTAPKKKRASSSSTASLSPSHKNANYMAQKLTSNNLRRRPTAINEEPTAVAAAAAVSDSGSKLPFPRSSSLSSSSSSIGASSSGSVNSYTENSSPSTERAISAVTTKLSSDSEDTSLSSTSSAASSSSSSSSDSDASEPWQLQKRRRQCRFWKKQHQVVPGRSWGSLTSALQDSWMKLQCDEFFCEPHSLAGKGVYTCVPLAKGKHATKNIEEELDRKLNSHFPSTEEERISKTL